ncbi:hypothetical protein [Kribbella pittospori]|nr:hypothetical protein [Kribbella pittospori]
MGNVLAALIGALAVLGGVGAGAWLQERREHERWQRGEKLTAAVNFISATGAIYDKRLMRSNGAAQASTTDEAADWIRAQDARSTLYLLCETATVDLAEGLIHSVRRAEPSAADGHHHETLDLLHTFVRVLRRELGVSD